MKKILTCFFIGLHTLLFAQIQDTTESKLHHYLGRDLLLQGKYEEAIKQLDSAISILPYGSELYYERGYAKVQLKKYKEAIIDFSMVINKHPERYQAYINRGIARYHIGNFYGAEKDIKQSMYYDPSNSTAHKYLKIIVHVIQEESNLNSTALTQAHKKVIAEQKLLEIERYNKRRQQEDSSQNGMLSPNFWTTTFLTW